MYKTLLLAQLFVFSVNCELCRRVESVDITFGDRFENGSIFFDGVDYPEGSWYEAEENNVTVTLGCPCIGRNCLWKCCPNGQLFVNGQCVASDLEGVNPFIPPIYKDTESLDINAKEHFFYVYSNRLCESRYLVDSLMGEGIYIQQNGSMMEEVEGRVQWHKPAYFCVDMMANGDNTTRLVAGPCHPTEEPISDDSSTLYTMYAAGLLLSAPFLLVTFLVYAFIPELRNLHGMCLMAYCAGLIVAYPFLAYLKMHQGTVGVGRTGCYVIAFIVYYSFQSSFFWLNVMCFDIWRTFRGYRGGSSKKRHEQRRFAMYGLYAWGVPVLLTALTAFMQFADLPKYLLKPGLGDMKCWFEDWKRDLIYFFTPVLVLVLCNTVLFSVTAHRIRSIKQETAILKSSESARSDRLKKDKQRYGLYLKLFMVMGVNWMVELISFAVGGSNWYWMVVDLSNIMLGFFIFFIFVWKKKVRNLVKKRKKSGCESWKKVPRNHRYFDQIEEILEKGHTMLLALLYSYALLIALCMWTVTRAIFLWTWAIVCWSNFCGSRTVADSLGKWATRTSSAPTEDTRVSADESAMRMKEIH